MSRTKFVAWALSRQAIVKAKRQRRIVHLTADVRTGNTDSGLYSFYLTSTDLGFFLSFHFCLLKTIPGISKIASFCPWKCLETLSCWRILAWNLSAFHWRGEIILVYLTRALIFQYYHMFITSFSGKPVPLWSLSNACGVFFCPWHLPTLLCFTCPSFYFSVPGKYAQVKSTGPQ